MIRDDGWREHFANAATVNLLLLTLNCYPLTARRAKRLIRRTVSNSIWRGLSFDSLALSLSLSLSVLSHDALSTCRHSCERAALPGATSVMHTSHINFQHTFTFLGNRSSSQSLIPNLSYSLSFKLYLPYGLSYSGEIISVYVNTPKIVPQTSLLKNMHMLLTGIKIWE